MIYLWEIVLFSVAPLQEVPSNIIKNDCFFLGDNLLQVELSITCSLSEKHSVTHIPPLHSPTLPSLPLSTPSQVSHSLLPLSHSPLPPLPLSSPTLPSLPPSQFSYSPLPLSSPTLPSHFHDSLLLFWQISCSVDKYACLNERFVACKTELDDVKLKCGSQDEEITKLR